MTEEQIEFLKDYAKKQIKIEPIPNCGDDIFDMVKYISMGMYHVLPNMSSKEKINQLIEKYHNELLQDLITSYDAFIDQYHEVIGFTKAIEKYGNRLFTERNTSNLRRYFQKCYLNKEIVDKILSEIRIRYKRYVKPNLIDTIKYFGLTYKKYTLHYARLKKNEQG